MGTNTQNPSRRSLLAALPAVGIAASAASARYPHDTNTLHPDAALIAACERLTALERRFMAVHDEIVCDDERESHVEAILEARRPDLEFVVATVATTLAGLRAKLTATIVEDQEVFRDATKAADLGPDKAGSNVALQGSLLRDLVAVLKPDVRFDAAGRPK